MDIVNQYQNAAEEFALGYNVTNSHVISIIASVMMTRDGKGIRGGGFVQAVVDNDLFEAINRADSITYAHLDVIVAANQYSYLE
jgi:hypothetical protein